MFEVGKPPEIVGKRFTALFATSPDMRRWEIAPPECIYAKDRYTSPHCPNHLDGYFYNFYLEAFPTVGSNMLSAQWTSSTGSRAL